MAKPAIDAILCPQTYPGNTDEVARHLARNAEFGPLLGVARVHSCHCPGGQSFVRSDPAAHPGPVHPKGHPKAGQPRYDWHDRGDGVMYGVLIPDESGPTPAQLAASLQARRKAEMEARINQLSAVAPDSRTAEQSAELARLTDWHQRLYPQTSTQAPTQETAVGNP